MDRLHATPGKYISAVRDFVQWNLSEAVSLVGIKSSVERKSIVRDTSRYRFPLCLWQIHIDYHIGAGRFASKFKLNPSDFIPGGSGIFSKIVANRMMGWEYFDRQCRQIGWWLQGTGADCDISPIDINARKGLRASTCTCPKTWLAWVD